MKHYRKLLSLLLIICISMTMLTGYIPVNAVTPTPEPPLESITPFELPDIVDAVEAEEKGYIGRVKTEEKDLYTFVFANGDGTNTMRVYGHPVKYVAKGGTIRDISLDVKAKADGGFVTADHEIITTFEKTLTNGVSLTYNDVEVTLVPKLGLGKSPTATLDSNNKVVTYKMNDVTSFVYELTYAGFKEDIVVKEYTGQTEYEFTLFTNGLTLCEEYGSYHLADAEGNVEATIGDIIVFTADERNNTMGSMTYETVRANQEYVLTIHLDADYLADEDTVYPIRIDPTIEINYDNNGAGAIEDITINSLQGSDGSSRSLFVGRRETYGLSRVLMKFPNLSLDGIYSGSIISATVELRDLICQGDEDITVECRIYNKNAPAWTEDETTSWQSVGTSYVGSLLDSHVISYGEGNVAGEQHRYSFNILNAVKAWAIGTEDPNKGLIFKANESFENQTGDDIKTWHKTFAAYNRSDYRPSLSIKYSTIFSLDYSVISIPEGESRILGANTNPSGQTVTWTTSNSTIATVSTSGVVTAKKAGTVTITASMIDADNVQHFATCTVYVYVANGVYYIQNSNSSLYLHVENGGIANLTNVCQYSKYSDSTRNEYRIRQMWKTHYLGDGRYSIRPMNKLDKGLDVTGSNVDIYSIGTTDILESMPYYGEWTISWYSTGYVFMNNGNDSQTMQIENASTLSEATVVVSAYSTSKNCRWTLTRISSPPSGAYWFNTNTETVVSGTSVGNQTIECGSTSDAMELGFVPVLYSSSSNMQTFTWSSDVPTIATVNSTSGLISAQNAGNAVITATSSYGKYKLQLNILSKSLDPLHYHNIQYMRYVRITGTNWWGLGSDTDHTINIVKSTMYSDDYCIIHDNINTGYYREIYINDELKNTLNNLEAGYQEHYSWLPLLDTTTEQENAAHSSKGETDQLVEDGYFTAGSSEYYGVWAYNYISTLNLADYWRGVIDTATAAYGVYLTATSFYYSYLMSTNTASMQVTSSQYNNTASIIDDIDDALAGINYTDKTVISAETRNNTLNLEKPPYKPGTPVIGYKTTQTTQYVRVYSEGVTSPQSKWLMRYSDIQGLTPAQIKDKFALPYLPTHYCYVDVPAGVQMYTGIANEITGWGSGSGIQFELGQFIPNGSYSSGLPLT